MPDTLLPHIEIETSPSPTATMIVLHGLGADGEDFVPIVEQLALPAHLRVRFIFPHAPVRKVTVNGGYAMRAWYDIASPDLAARPDVAGMQQSQAHVEALLRSEEERGIPAERVILAGFSQGGALALYAGLRHAHRLAGIIALSTYLMAPETLAREASEGNRATPVFMGHGTQDPIVSLARGEAGRRALEGLGYAVEWHTYPMGHGVVGEEIGDISTFIRRCLS